MPNPRHSKEFVQVVEEEWPENRSLVAKIRRGEPLSECDREWLKELSEVT